ncbi:MAG: hypothetical protein HRU10_02140 [Opitutales bacterium]|nr:hypothetical protein [Opitutales bacterium]
MKKTLSECLGFIAIIFSITCYPLSAGESRSVEHLSKIYLEITDAAEEARSRSEHPLWQRHIDSVLALLEVDIARVRLGYDLHLEEDGTPSSKSHASITRSIELHQNILAGLKGDAGDPENHFGGGKSLIMSFVSKVDRSIQYYSLVLPKGWSHEKAYPLLTTLHGMGPDHPLTYVHIFFSSKDKGPAPNSDRSKPDSGILEPHITIRPWGRGNNWYVGFAGIDVQEALDDLNHRIKTDRARWYLTGHSMGGSACWHLAIHRPDLWAAVFPFANAWNYIDTDSTLVENLKGIPFYFQTGEKDERLVPITYERAAAIDALGNPMKIEILPDIGHRIPKNLRRHAKQWMFQYSKPVPDQFTYQIDPMLSHVNLGYIAPWGVRTRVKSYGEPAHFSFTLDKTSNTIHLTTRDVKYVEFDPKPLQLETSMTVTINGVERYQGEAELVEFKKID